MNNQADIGIYRDPEFARFYDLDNGGPRPDFDLCASLATNARSVLDLGCGTGEFAAALAHCRDVVGVDPAEAMINIARTRPGGERAEWVVADARSVRLGRQFDLVVLTGHAFQVFLASEDQMAVMKTIARHLAPSGRFVFDSRNPRHEAWQKWTQDLTKHVFEHAELGQVEGWTDAIIDDASGIVTYTTNYRTVGTGKVQTATEQIRFTPQTALAEMIEDTGLSVDRWLGDWHGSRFEPSSREIIPIGSLKQPRQQSGIGQS